MKTMYRFIVVLALAILAGTATGAGNLSVKMQAVAPDRALMAISTLGNSSFSITVTDAENKVVYFQELDHAPTNYRKVFDFSKLEDGKYRLSVKSDGMTCDREFEKKFRSISIGDENTRLEPYFGFDNGLLRFTYLNFDKRQVSLRFYDEKNLIYSKEIGRNFTITEALNLQKLGKGDYRAVLTNGLNEYSYALQIR